MSSDRNSNSNNTKEEEEKKAKALIQVESNSSSNNNKEKEKEEKKSTALVIFRELQLDMAALMDYIKENPVATACTVTGATIAVGCLSFIKRGVPIIIQSRADVTKTGIVVKGNKDIVEMKVKGKKEREILNHAHRETMFDKNMQFHQQQQQQTVMKTQNREFSCWTQQSPPKPGFLAAKLYPAFLDQQDREESVAVVVTQNNQDSIFFVKATTLFKYCKSFFE